MKFGYEVFNAATKELLATGETMHVFCDKLGRTKSLPEKYRKYFPASEKHTSADHATPRKS